MQSTSNISRTSTHLPSSSCTASECNLNSAERVESIEGLDDDSPLIESCQIPCGFANPVTPSICWASDKVSERGCSSDDLSSDFITSHQPSLSSDTDTADATVAEETLSEVSQRSSIELQNPSESSALSFSTQQHKSIEVKSYFYNCN